MKRREFIALLGGAAVWPLAARAQQHRGPARLAFIPLGSPSNPYDRSLVEAFQRGLRRVGLIENQDVALDVVWPGDRPDQAVSEALQRGAELLIPCGSSASVAARRQTSTIPIVFLSVGDPVAVGLVESLSRPGQKVQRYPCGIEWQAGGCDAGDDQAAQDNSLSLAHSVAGRPKPLPSHGGGGPCRRNAAATQRHC